MTYKTIKQHIIPTVSFLSCIALLLGFGVVVSIQPNRYEVMKRKTVTVNVRAITTITVTTKKGKKEITEQRVIPIAIRGSGVFISKTGHILTCAHLFDEGKIVSIVVQDHEGNIQKVDLLDQDPKKDLALLLSWSEPKYYATLQRVVRVGEEVFAVGTALGLPHTVTKGIVSFIDRADIGDYPLLQTDAAINPGNSGGPLFNARGELVGINNSILPPVRAPIFTGLGFAVRVQEIEAFLERFKGL